MRNILLFESFVNEGMKSENIINMLMEVILERVNLETLENNHNDRYKGKPSIEYTYKTFFNAYKNDDFIKKMFDFFKKEGRNPKIIFRFERKYSYNIHQNDNRDPNGYYDTDTSDIQVNIFETKLDLKQIKQTLSHELRHLYDDVIRNSKKYDNEDEIAYKNKPSEIRARISGFINSYNGWDKNINDIIKDAELAIKSDNYDRKKLLKLIYALKNTGLNKHVIIPSKKLEGRKMDIGAFIKEAESNNVFAYYQEDQRIINIDNSILSINSIDDVTGDLGYPLLEFLLDIYDKKNINISISNNSLSLILIMKEKYNRDVIHIRQKKNWNNGNTLKVKYLLSKNGKIPNYEKIGDVEELNYDKVINDFYNKYQHVISYNLVDFINKLGLTNEHMITCVQRICDLGKYFFMTEEFYLKWKDSLDFTNCDIQYFTIKDKDKDNHFYLINGEKSPSINMESIRRSENYKKIK